MDFYLYFKAIHIIAVISWMAGMLYLPRLFAYHCNKGNSKEKQRSFFETANIEIKSEYLREIISKILE